MLCCIRIKCYQQHNELLSFAAAEAVCHSQSVSSADAHLMHIRDRDELLSAMRLCRGARCVALLWFIDMLPIMSLLVALLTVTPARRLTAAGSG